MEGSRRRVNFRTSPECHQRSCHFCLARSNWCPKVSPEHLESSWELSWLTHLCHQVASSGMVERGEKKRSPGQAKERKKGKTINVMLHRAQSLKSFSWWYIISVIRNWLHDPTMQSLGIYAREIKVHPQNSYIHKYIIHKKKHICVHTDVHKVYSWQPSTGDNPNVHHHMNG